MSYIRNVELSDAEVLLKYTVRMSKTQQYHLNVKRRL